MHHHRFDRLTRGLAAPVSRRRIVSSWLVAALALPGSEGRVVAEASCKAVGRRCRKAEDCCSDRCAGKRGRKHCQAHDTGDCPPRAMSDGCAGVENSTILCITSSGVEGRCETTTGNAPYCAGGGDCFTCTKDADCQHVCGDRAACVRCPVGCSGAAGTQCVGPDGIVCPL